MRFAIHQNFHTLAIWRTKLPFGYFSVLPAHIYFHISTSLQSVCRAFLPGISGSRKKFYDTFVRLNQHFEHSSRYTIVAINL